MSKNILIIYPHWPPSNLAGVHRARLISNFLPEFGWNPIILTVDSKYYEEPIDLDMLKIVSDKTEVQHVSAYPVTQPRIIGDIGLRAIFQLKRAALEILRNREIDFLWIPIPSFYVSLLGRLLHHKTGVPYGIDYIDPWVRDISNRKNVRSILSVFLARLLEPVAVKKAALISGVSTEYYQPVLERNFKGKIIEHVGMPYGFDPEDHDIKLSNVVYPWDQCIGCIPYVYAGAFLPNSGLFIKLLFRSISELRNEHSIDKNIRLYFIGTGNYSYKSIEDYAMEFGISDMVIEIRQRVPYLHALNYLSAAKGVLLIGSTEKHYTASKTFQSLLSGKPVFSIMHESSSAVRVFEDADADQYLIRFSEYSDIDTFQLEITDKVQKFFSDEKTWSPNYSSLEKYSSKESAKALVFSIERVLSA